MARVVGLTRSELLTREQVFEGLTSKAVRMTTRVVTANLDKILTAAPTLTTADEKAISVTWNSYVAAELYPYLVQTFVESAGDVRSKIDGLTDADIPKVDTDFAVQYLRQAANRLKGIGDVIWSNMREQLAEGYDAGETTQQLATRMRAVASISEPRALMIARTEIVPAANFASLHQVQLAGFTDDECRKGWLSTDDARTRPEHRAADGQQVPLSKPFTVGGEKLNFPGDWSLGATADNVIQCRCSIEFNFDDDIVTADSSFEALHPRGDDGRFGHKPAFHILPKELRGKSGDGMYAPGMWGKYGGSGIMMRHVDQHGTARYMVVQRATSGYNKWRWQLPGGAREQNETAIQAAAREANEETGITPDQLATLTPRGTHTVELPVEGKAPWTYSSVVADAPEAFRPKIDYEELGAARWLTYDQLVEMRGRGRLIAPFAAQLEDIIAKFDEPTVAGFIVDNVVTSTDYVDYLELMTAVGKHHADLPDPNWDESKVKRDTEGKFAKKTGVKVPDVNLIDESFGGGKKTPAKPKKKTAAEIKAHVAKIKSEAKAAQAPQAPAQPVGTGKVAAPPKPIHINTNVIYKQTYADGAVIAQKTDSTGEWRLTWSESKKKFTLQKIDGAMWTPQGDYGKGDAYKKFSKETGWHEPIPDGTPAIPAPAGVSSAPYATLPDFSNPADNAKVAEWYENLTQDLYDSLTPLEQIKAKDNAYTYDQYAKGESFTDKLDKFDAAADEEFYSVPSTGIPDFVHDSYDAIDAWFINLTQDAYDALLPDQQSLVKTQAKYYFVGVASNGKSFIQKIKEFDAVAAGKADAELIAKLDKMDPGQFLTWFNQEIPSKAEWNAQTEPVKVHLKTLAQGAKDFFGVAGPFNAIDHWSKTRPEPAVLGEPVADVGLPDTALLKNMSAFDFNIWFQSNIDQSMWNGLSDKEKNALKTLAKKTSGSGFGKPLEDVNAWESGVPPRAATPTGSTVALIKSIEDMNSSELDTWFDNNLTKSQWDSLDQMQKNKITAAAHDKNAAVALDVIKSYLIKDLTPEQLHGYKSDQKIQIESDIEDLVEKGWLTNQDELKYLHVKKAAAKLSFAPSPPVPAPSTSLSPSSHVTGSKYHVDVHGKIKPISDIGTPDATSSNTVFHKLTPSAAVTLQNYMLDVHQKKITPDQVAAVQRYTTSVGYRSTNAVLRDDADQLKGLSASDLQAGVKNAVDLQNAMSPITQNTQVFRGTGAHAFGQKGIHANFAQLKKLEGKTLTDKGFMSTTVLEKPPVSYDYAKKPIQMIVDVPAGSPAAYVSAITPGWSKENELILGAGSTYRIKEVREATAADKAQFSNPSLEHVVHVEVVPSTGDSSHKISSPTDHAKTPKPVSVGTSTAPPIPSVPMSVTVNAKPIKLNTNVIHKQKYTHGAVVAVKPGDNGAPDQRLVWNENVKKFILQENTGTGWLVFAGYSKKDAYQTFGVQTGWFEPLPGETAIGTTGFGGAPVPSVSSPLTVLPSLTTPAPTPTVKQTKMDAAALQAMHGDISDPMMQFIAPEVFNDFKKGLGYNTHLGTPPEFVFDKMLKVQDKWKTGKAKPNLLQILKIVDEKSTPAGAVNEGKYEKKIVDWLQTPQGAMAALDAINAPPPPVPGALPKGAVISSTGEISHAVQPHSAEVLAAIAKIKPASSIGTIDPSDTAFPPISTTKAKNLQDAMLAGNPWTTSQQSALTTYTGSSYHSINGVLRNDPTHISHLSEATKAKWANTARKMQDGMRPLPQSVTLYRKTGFKQLPGLSDSASFDAVKAFDGKVFIDRGFFSGSVTEGTWHGKLHMTLEVAKGVPAAWVKQISANPDENEMILASGLKYRVISVTKGYGSNVHMKLRVEI